MPNKETEEALEHLLKPKKKFNIPANNTNQEKKKEKIFKDEEISTSESSFSVVDIPAPTLKSQEIESAILEDLTKEAKQERAASMRETGKKEEESLIKYGPTLYDQEERRVDTIGRMDDMRRLGTFGQKDINQPMARQRVEMPDMPGSQAVSDIEKYVADRAIDLADVWRDDDLIKKPSTLKKYRK